MSDEPATDASIAASGSSRPGPRENATALALVLVTFVILAAVAPFAHMPLARSNDFIPAYESALAVIELVTAALLFGYGRRRPSAATIALACAYLFAFPLIVAHALAFPGAFSPEGLFGAGSQSAPWLYAFWHVGFSVLILAYVLMVDRPAAARWGAGSKAWPLAVGATLAADAGLIVLAINGHGALPTILVGQGYASAAYLLVGPALLFSSLVALVMLCLRRKVSTLDLWLFTVMCAWMCDIYLSAMRGTTRFDLGWYAGRLYGLVAASILLVMLVLDFNRAQARLQRHAADIEMSEARLRAIFETTHLYQGLLARDGSLIYTNTNSLRGLPVSLADLIGKPYWDAPWFSTTPGMPQTIRRAVEQAAAGENVGMEIRLDLPDGARWFDFAIRPIANERGQVMAMVPEAADITERRKTEESLRQSQKIEALGQLTGGVAHDFNNLLMVITGGLSMLDRQTDPDRRKRIMDGMRQAADRGASLNRQLLAFARRQPLKTEVIDLRAKISGMRELLDRTLRGDVPVEMELADDLWPIRADPTEFELAILNLCVNARDAMPEGGTIILRAANAPGERRDGVAGDFVRLEVVDVGVGIAPDVLERVFEPFFTTKDVGRGSGLGLAQVHGFANQSGGTVSVASEPGRGTTVIMLLPRSAVAPVADEAPAAEAPAVTVSRRGSVLLVEDDDEVAALVAEMLSQLGFVVTRTAGAQAALGALADGRPVDVVLSDVMMPGPMNGVDLAREVRRRRPDLPVLLTSGYAEAVAATAAAENLALLPKPYDLGMLDKTMRAALAGR